MYCVCIVLFFVLLPFCMADLAGDSSAIKCCDGYTKFGTDCIPTCCTDNTVCKKPNSCGCNKKCENATELIIGIKYVCQKCIPDCANVTTSAPPMVINITTEQFPFSTEEDISFSPAIDSSTTDSPTFTTTTTTTTPTTLKSSTVSATAVTSSSIKLTVIALASIVAIASYID